MWTGSKYPKLFDQYCALAVLIQNHPYANEDSMVKEETGSYAKHI